MLQGRSEKKASVYIGATARERAHQLALAEKQKQIDVVKVEIHQIQSELNELEDIQNGMKEEFENRPSTKILGQLCDQLFEDHTILNNLYERQKQLEKSAVMKKREYEQACQIAAKSCSAFPYERTVRAYEDVLSQLKLYQRMFSSYSSFQREIEKYTSMIVQNEEVKERAEVDCDFMNREKQSLETEL